MQSFPSLNIADAYTKGEVNSLIESVKPHVVKLEMPNSSTVTYTDFDNVVQSIVANATGSATITFKNGFVPRSYSFGGQSNVVCGHTAPMPTDGTIELVFKLVSTGANFNPNECLLNFYKA